jgi:hypothetical protein
LREADETVLTTRTAAAVESLYWITGDHKPRKQGGAAVRDFFLQGGTDAKTSRS